MVAEPLGVTQCSVDGRDCCSAEDLMFVPILVAVRCIKIRDPGLIRSVLPRSLHDIFIYGLKLLGVELGPRLLLLDIQPASAKGVWCWPNTPWFESRVSSAK